MACNPTLASNYNLQSIILMSTLIILIFSFVLVWSLNKYVFRNALTMGFMGKVALAIMLIFTGSSHFFKTEEMVQMMPEILPYKIELVYLTGILEVVFAFGLLVERYSKWTSIALVLFLLAILPANIVGAFKRVELGGMENGPAYLYFRIPLQLLFVVWTVYFGIYLSGEINRKQFSYSNKQ